jgi:hypothetical protein
MLTQPQSPHQMGQQNEECIRQCLETYRLTLQTVRYCLDKGGDYSTVNMIQRLLDCAEICRASASYLIRSSDKQATICTGCAEICLLCANDCEHFSNDKSMKDCAQQCRSCAEYCQMILANASEISRMS